VVVASKLRSTQFWTGFIWAGCLAVRGGRSH